jgi:hypothetical protein
MHVRRMRLYTGELHNGDDQKKYLLVIGRVLHRQLTAEQENPIRSNKKISPVGHFP